MKAITCTQCGATLENVSPTSVIIECEYCGARIMIDEKAEKPKPPVQVEPPAFYAEDQPARRPTVFAGVVAAFLLIPVFITAIALVSRPSRPTPSKVYSAPASPAMSPAPGAWSASTNPPAKPLPVVNYQPRVAWDGPDDMEYFADPEVDVSSLSDKTSEEVEKIVFKNRVVKLRVVINPEGEINEVETISGHPILVQAATESAKRSIFSSRSKPTKRVLTYTFRVLKD